MVDNLGSLPWTGILGFGGLAALTLAASRVLGARAVSPIQRRYTAFRSYLDIIAPRPEEVWDDVEVEVVPVTEEDGVI